MCVSVESVTAMERAGQGQFIFPVHTFSCLPVSLALLTGLKENCIVIFIDNYQKGTLHVKAACGGTRASEAQLRNISIKHDARRNCRPQVKERGDHTA